MKLPKACLKAVFIRRVNRFVAEVELQGEKVVCHVANPGRLTNMLHAGQTAYVKPADDPHGRRSTKYDLVAVDNNGTITTIDSRLPGILIGEALNSQQLPPFQGYTEVKPEYRFGASRIDFFCQGQGLQPCLIEVKSAATAAGDVALFPDAPTERGRRHLLELTAAVEQGYRCAVVLVCQAGAAVRVGINEPLDPDFGAAFRTALKHGVEAYAFQQVFIAPDQVLLGRELPVVIYRDEEKKNGA